MAMEVILSVNKKHVMEEVGKTTSYVGGHIDAETYDSVSTTEENDEILTTFWEDAKAACCHAIGEYLIRSGEDVGGEFTLCLEMPKNWKSELKDVMQRELRAYFESYIEARWFAVALKEEAQAYEGRASEFLKAMCNAALERNRPKRI